MEAARGVEVRSFSSRLHADVEMFYRATIATVFLFCFAHPVRAQGDNICTGFIISLQSSAASIPLGGQVTLTATVTYSIVVGPAPNGTLTFLDSNSGTVIATVFAAAGGAVAITLTPSPGL